MEARDRITIRLCGPLVVEMEGRRLEAALPSRQGRLVFAYLVLHRARAVSRGELVEALWPGRAPAAAQTLLTELLSRLRSALPAGVLEGRSQLSLQLDGDAWIDVEVAAGALPQARDALAAQDASAAITIARDALELLVSPLLGDIDRPWLDESRRALDELRAGLLDLVARAGLRAAGDGLAPAAAAARELIELEPFRESAYGLLMEVHAARGDVAHALRVLERVVGARAGAIAALDEAVATGLLRETAGVAGGYAFVHALAREAVYDTMTSTRRAALHLRTAEALEPDASPAVLAHHFFEARHIAGPEKAAAYHVAAAEDSFRGLAYEDEIAHYAAALRALDDAGSIDDEMRCRILLGIAEREINLGGSFRAHVERAADIAELGRLDHASVRLLRKALTALGDEDSSARARTLSRLAEALLGDSGAREHRDALSRQALEMARRTGDDEVLMGVIHARIEAITGPDSIDERLALSGDALDLAQRLGDRGWALRLHAGRASLFTELNQPAAARAELDAQDALLDQLRLHGTYDEAEAAILHARRCLLDGDLAASERLAREAHAILVRLDDPDADYLLVAQLLPIRMSQGLADELVPDIARWAARPGRELPWRALLGLVHLRAGRRAEARDQFVALATDDFSPIPLDGDWLGTLAVLAEICSAVGDPDHARALQGRLQPYADRIALLIYSSMPIGPVWHSLGRLALSHGRIEDAIAAFEHAHAAARTLAAPIMTREIAEELAAARSIHRREREPHRAGRPRE